MSEQTFFRQHTVFYILLHKHSLYQHHRYLDGGESFSPTNMFLTNRHNFSHEFKFSLHNANRRNIFLWTNIGISKSG